VVLVVGELVCLVPVLVPVVLVLVVAVVARLVARRRGPCVSAGSDPREFLVSRWGR